MQPLSSLPVLMTPGVFSVVSSGGTPVPIPDEEINRIKTFVDAGLSPRPWPYIASGMHILIASGPLKGITGIVSEMSNEKWLVVSVSLLKQSVAVKIARDEFSIQPC
jgi:transcription antitermination factor NusG